MPEEVSNIGVRLTLDASGFTGPMAGATQALDKFQAQAARASTGAAQSRAGGGGGTHATGTPMGVDVTLAVSQAEIGRVRAQIIKGLGSIPITISPQFAKQGNFSLPNVLGSMLSMQYGTPKAQAIREATQFTERFVGQTLPQKAAGGPVAAHRPVIVGERRPEVFVPRVSGDIVPSVAQYQRSQHRQRLAEEAALANELRREREHQRRMGGMVHALRGTRVPPLGPGVSMPPPFGEAPLREGYVRGYHRTRETFDPSIQKVIRTTQQNLDSIRRHGLRLKEALGSTYGEPNASWFTNEPYEQAHAIEAHLPARWFDSAKRRRTDPGTIGGPSGNMAVYGNISRRRIASFSEPWMATTRSLMEEIGRVGGTAYPTPRTPGSIMREFGPMISRWRGETRKGEGQDESVQGYDQFVAEMWRRRQHRMGGGYAEGGFLKRLLSPRSTTGDPVAHYLRRSRLFAEAEEGEGGAEGAAIRAAVLRTSTGRTGQPDIGVATSRIDILSNRLRRASQSEMRDRGLNAYFKREWGTTSIPEMLKRLPAVMREPGLSGLFRARQELAAMKPFRGSEEFTQLGATQGPRLPSRGFQWPGGQAKSMAEFTPPLISREGVLIDPATAEVFGTSSRETAGYTDLGFGFSKNAMGGHVKPISYGPGFAHRMSGGFAQFTTADFAQRRFEREQRDAAQEARDPGSILGGGHYGRWKKIAYANNIPDEQWEPEYHRYYGVNATGETPPYGPTLGRFAEATSATASGSRLEKLQAMATQTTQSPREAEIARRMLRERGVPGYHGGGYAHAMAGKDVRFYDPKARQITPHGTRIWRPNWDNPLHPIHEELALHLGEEKAKQIAERAQAIDLTIPEGNFEQVLAQIPRHHTELVRMQPTEALYKLGKMLEYTTHESYEQNAPSLDEAISALLGYHWQGPRRFKRQRSRGGPTHAWHGRVAEAYRATLEHGGGTFPVDPRTPVPSRGHALALGKLLGSPTEFAAKDDPVAFIRAFHKQKRAGAPFVGTWLPEGEQNIYVDPSVVMRIKREADMVARFGEEQAMFNLKTFEDEPTSKKKLRATAERITQLMRTRQVRAMGGYAHAADGVKKARRPAGWQRAAYPQEVLESNIEAVTMAMSPSDIAIGKRWYPFAHDLTVRAAAHLGFTDIDRALAIVAATSPRQKFLGNMAHAMSMMEGAKTGVPPTKADADKFLPLVETWITEALGPHQVKSMKGAEGLMGVNYRKAWNLATTNMPIYGPQTLQGLKVVPFHKNLSGDLDAITVDALATQIATAGTTKFTKSQPGHTEGISPDFRISIADAYRTVFAKHGKRLGFQHLAEFQAATWTRWRGEAMKRGGHAAKGTITGEPGGEFFHYMPAVPPTNIFSPDLSAIQMMEMITSPQVRAADVANYGEQREHALVFNPYGGLIRHVVGEGRSVAPGDTRGYVTAHSHPEHGGQFPVRPSSGDYSAMFASGERESLVLTPKQTALIRSPDLYQQKTTASVLAGILNEVPAKNRYAEIATEEAERLGILPDPLRRLLGEPFKGLPPLGTKGNPMEESWRRFVHLINKPNVMGNNALWDRVYARLGDEFGSEYMRFPASAHMKQPAAMPGSMYRRLPHLAGGGFLSSILQTAADWSKDPFMAIMAYQAQQQGRQMAQGGSTDKGLYIVGEIGPELFVPDRLKAAIPKGVMDQIPHAGGGMQIIGKTPNSLFAPAEDGIIVPNRLMDKVAHRQFGGEAEGWPDSDVVLSVEDRARRESERREAEAHAARSERSRRAAATRARRRADEAAAAAAAGPPPVRPFGTGGPGFAPPLTAAEMAAAGMGAASAAAPPPPPRAATPPPAGGAFGTVPPTMDEIKAAGGLDKWIALEKARMEFAAKPDPYAERRAAARTSATEARRRGIDEPDEMETQMEQLRVMRAGQGQLMGGRTALGAVANMMSFMFGGREQFSQEQARAGIALTDFKKVMRETRGIIDENTIHLASLNTTELEEGETREQRTTEIRKSEGLLAEAEGRRTVAVKELDEAERKAMPTRAGALKNLGVIIASTQFYGMAIGMASKVLDEALIPATGKWIDEMQGFTSTSQRVTSALADQTRAQGGNYQAALAVTGVQTGMSAATFDWSASILQATTVAKAGSKAYTDFSEIFRATIGAAGRAPQGLFGGYGGIGGGSLFAEQLGGGKGLFEQVVGDIQAARGRQSGGFDIGQVLESAVAGGVGGFAAGSVVPFFGNIAGALGGAVAGAGINTAVQLQASGGSLGGLTGRATPAETHLLEDINAAMGRAAGREGGGAYTLKQVGGDMYKGMDVPKEIAQLSSQGYAFFDASGKMVDGLDGITAAAEQFATGLTIPDIATWSKTVERNINVKFAQIDIQGGINRGLLIPFQFAMQRLAAPPLAAGAGIVPGAGLSGKQLAGLGLTRGAPSDIAGFLSAPTSEGGLGMGSALAGTVAGSVGRTKAINDRLDREAKAAIAEGYNTILGAPTSAADIFATGKAASAGQTPAAFKPTPGFQTPATTDYRPFPGYAGPEGRGAGYRPAGAIVGLPPTPGFKTPGTIDYRPIRPVIPAGQGTEQAYPGGGGGGITKVPVPAAASTTAAVTQPPHIPGALAGPDITPVPPMGVPRHYEPTPGFQTPATTDYRPIEKVTEATTANTKANQDAANEYTRLMDRAQASSARIRELQNSIAALNESVNTAQWKETTRLAERNLSDLKGVMAGAAGKKGGSLFGQLEGQMYAIGRASQALDISLEKRRIATQLAVAGFAAPGATGEERYAMQKQQIAEAGIAKTKVGFAEDLFTKSGAAWKIQAKRMFDDATIAWENSKKAHDAEIAIAGFTGEIAAESASMAKDIAKADSLLNDATAKASTGMDALSQYASTFGTNLTNMSDLLGQSAPGLRKFFEAVGFTFATNPKTGATTVTPPSFTGGTASTGTPFVLGQNTGRGTGKDDPGGGGGVRGTTVARLETGVGGGAAGAAAYHFGGRGFTGDDASALGSSKHSGIDLPAAQKTPVHAVAGGTVSYAASEFANVKAAKAAHAYGGGNTVNVDDAFGTWQYAHLFSIAVRKGQHIGAGTVVGLVGHTGRYADQPGTKNDAKPHLHLGREEGGKWIDPLTARMASGFLGNVGKPTQMTMGEAGTETVAILRNPRMAMLNMGGGMMGGGGARINVNINGPVVRDDKDIHELARCVAVEVERILGRKGQLLGLRGPSV